MLLPTFARCACIARCPDAALSLASRRLLLQTVATAAIASPNIARADYGASAQQKLPAFVPSPIRPTGEMAKKCEIVALGREDVCLEYKKLLTAYEELQLNRALEEIEGSDSEVKGLLQSVLDSDWSSLKSKLESPTIATLDIKALATACKKEDSQAATKAVLKLAKGV